MKKKDGQTGNGKRACAAASALTPIMAIVDAFLLLLLRVVRLLHDTVVVAATAFHVVVLLIRHRWRSYYHRDGSGRRDEEWM